MAMDISLYRDHLKEITQIWRCLITENQCDAVLVSAGQNTQFWGDDQEPPFHANAHFLRWLPYSSCEHSCLLVSLDQETRLFWYVPEDYWYLPSAPPDFCLDCFEVYSFSDLDKLQAAVRRELRHYQHVALLGPTANAAQATCKDQSKKLLKQLDFDRAFKTPHEVSCMQEATLVAVRGHRAAEKAFREGGSEFEIHMAYLQASEQNEANLPYPNIVGLNEHAATLHYQRYDRQKPSEHRTLLIDAGANSNCYHADVTRTHVFDINDEYQFMVQALDAAQQSLITQIEVGKSFEELHYLMSQKISAILVDFDIVRCSAEAAEKQHLVDAFFPHGLGHLLGLQTHDVGGLIHNEIGEETDPHPRYQSLRLRRNVEARMVFTIEPGIYFIPVLLKQLDNHVDINWEKVKSLLPFGGMRIEDNVLVEAGNVQNLTRNAFAEIAA